MMNGEGRDRGNDMYKIRIQEVNLEGSDKDEVAERNREANFRGNVIYISKRAACDDHFSLTSLSFN